MRIATYCMGSSLLQTGTVHSQTKRNCYWVGRSLVMKRSNSSDSEYAFAISVKQSIGH